MIGAGELIEECQLMLGDPHGDFHTTERMLIFLNRSLRSLSSRSQSIVSWKFHSIVEDEFRYGLPTNFLRAKIVGYASSNRGWYQLTVRKDSSVDRLAQSDYTGGGGEPVHYYIGGRSADERLVATVKSVDATDLVFESDAPLITTDSPLRNVYVGDRLINVSDGSEGVVETAGGEGPGFNKIGYSGLLGGTRNRFVVGDQFRIVSPNESFQTLNVAPVPNFTSDVGEEPLHLYYSRYHNTVTQHLIDNDNDVLEIEPELESPLLHYVCYWAALAEGNPEDPRAVQFMGTYNSEMYSSMPRVRKRMQENANGWVRWVSTYPRKANLTGAPDIGGHPFTGTDIY